MDNARSSHWNDVYLNRSPEAVSWYESEPRQSLDMIRRAAPDPSAPIIDVGAGASLLVDRLLACGYCDVTVLDISVEALNKVRERLGPRAADVHFIAADATMPSLSRRYAVWHDRAVFHFLVEPGDRRRYVEALQRALQPDGQVLIAAFGPQGPERCSGLPVVRYDVGKLAGELGDDFELQEQNLQSHRTPAGAMQQFLYCRFALRALPARAQN